MDEALAKTIYLCFSDFVDEAVADGVPAGAKEPFMTAEAVIRLLACAAALATSVAAPGGALAAGPVPRDGACPSGYTTSGAYCVPRAGVGQAVERDGACPSGYVTSGDYCVARDAGTDAIRREGACPSGYVTSGNYCVSR